MLNKEINYILSEDDETRLNEIRAIIGWPLPNPIAESTNPWIRVENNWYRFLKAHTKQTPEAKKFPDGNPNVKRENFGIGSAGDWAFQTIRNGAECDAYIDDEKNKCSQLAVGTVDVDINSNLDLFPYCSEGHAKILTEQLVTEIEHNDAFTVPSRNGFGRELVIFEAQER